MLEAIDGQRTVREIIASVDVGSFDACKILYQFLQSRLVRTAGRLEPSGRDSHQGTRPLERERRPSRTRYARVVSEARPLDSWIKLSIAAPMGQRPKCDSSPSTEHAFARSPSMSLPSSNAPGHAFGWRGTKQARPARSCWYGSSPTSSTFSAWPRSPNFAGRGSPARCSRTRSNTPRAARCGSSCSRCAARTQSATRALPRVRLLGHRGTSALLRRQFRRCHRNVPRPRPPNGKIIPGSDEVRL